MIRRTLSTQFTSEEIEGSKGQITHPWSDTRKCKAKITGYTAEILAQTLDCRVPPRLGGGSGGKLFQIDFLFL